jgi:hypothetical protein
LPLAAPGASAIFRKLIALLQFGDFLFEIHGKEL